MANQNTRAGIRVDALGLILAGLINTFLASADAGLILAPGTATAQPDLLLRIHWIPKIPSAGRLVGSFGLLSRSAFHGVITPSVVI